jgi:hypothetical protein
LRGARSSAVGEVKIAECFSGVGIPLRAVGKETAPDDHIQGRELM